MASFVAAATAWKRSVLLCNAEAAARCSIANATEPAIVWAIATSSGVKSRTLR